MAPGGSEAPGASSPIKISSNESQASSHSEYQAASSSSEFSHTSTFLEPDDIITSYDQGPSPEESVVKGHNLQIWDHIATTLEDPVTAPTRLVFQVAGDLLRQHPFRNIRTSAQASGDVVYCGWTINKKLFKKEFFLRKLTYQQRKALAPFLKQILDRLPCFPNEISQNAASWVSNVAMHLATAQGHEMKAQHLAPRFLRRENHFVISIRGYDETAKESERNWHFRPKIVPGSVDRNLQIALPDNIEWLDNWRNLGRGDASKKHTGRASYDDHDFQQALDLAKYIHSQLDGFIGAKEDCKLIVRYLKDKYRVPVRQRATTSRQNYFGPYRGRPIWNGPQIFFLHPEHSILSISSSVKHDLHASHLPWIVLNSKQLSDWLPVCKVINDIFETSKGHVLRALRAGYLAADEINKSLASGELINAPTHCQRKDTPDHFDVCLICHRSLPCHDIEYCEDLGYDVCTSCASDLQDETGLKLKDVNGIWRVYGEESPVKRNLIFRLNIENGHLGKPWSRKQLKDIADRVMKDLEVYKVLDENGEWKTGLWHDAYVDQVLDENEERVQVWTGKHRRLTAPTIEAIHSIAKTVVNGETVCGYHQPGNICLISFPRQMLKGTYPPVMMKAVSQIRMANNRTEFEQGVAIIREIHRGQLERHYNSRLQSRRIGQPLPDDFEDWLEFSRTATRQSRIHVPPAMLWRWTSRKIPKRGADWTPDDWEYLSEGIEHIAERYNLHEGENRKLWEKDGVPYFFTAYAVTTDWSRHAFMNHEAERFQRMRNVCDRNFALKYPDQPELRPDMSIAEFIFNHAQLFMRLLAKDLTTNNGKLNPKPPGLDPSGLPLHPTIRLPTCISFGHRVHGDEMLSAYKNTRPSRQDHWLWEYEEGGIDMESQGRNMRRWDLPNHVIDEIEGEDLQLRSFGNNQIGPEILPLGPISYAEPVLRDEVNAQYEPEDDKWKMVDIFYTDVMRAAHDEALKEDDQSDEDLDEEFEEESLGIDDDEEEIDENPEFLEDGTKEISVARRNGDSDSASDHSSRPEDDPAAQYPALLRQPRNMGRLEHTCFMSSAVQLLHNCATLRHEFIGNPTCDIVLGRDSTVLTNYRDPNGMLHDNFMAKLSAVMEQLDVSNPNPVSDVFTKALLEASGVAQQGQVSPKDSHKYAAWKDQDDDAVEYLLFILGRAQVVLDRTNPAEQAAAAAELAALQQSWSRSTVKIDTHTLGDYILRHWSAWTRKTACTSTLSQLCLTHVLQESQCKEPWCGAILVDMDCLPLIRLYPSIASQPSLDVKIEFSRLVQQYLQGDDLLDLQPRMCNHCRSGELGNRLRRIVHFPEYFFIHIDRSNKSPEGGDESTRADAEENVFTNEIEIPETMSPSLWTKPGQLPTDPDADSVPSVHGQYRLIGIVAFMDVKKHWITYIRLGDSNKGPWYCFDDTSETVPKPVEPWNALAHTRQYASLLLYKLEDQADKPSDSHVAVPMESRAVVQEVVAAKQTDTIGTTFSNAFIDSLLKHDTSGTSLMTLLSAVLKAVPLSQASTAFDIINRDFNQRIANDARELVSASGLQTHRPTKATPPRDTAASTVVLPDTEDLRTPAVSPPGVDPQYTFEPVEPGSLRRRPAQSHYEPREGSEFQPRKTQLLSRPVASGVLSSRTEVDTSEHGSEVTSRTTRLLFPNLFRDPSQRVHNGSQSGPALLDIFRPPPSTGRTVQSGLPFLLPSEQRAPVAMSAIGSRAVAKPTSRSTVSPESPHTMQMEARRSLAPLIQEPTVVSTTVSDPRTSEGNGGMKKPSIKHWPCPVAKKFKCSQTFDRRDLADRHATQSHDPKPFACPFKYVWRCNEMFASPKAAFAHAKDAHDVSTKRCTGNNKKCSYRSKNEAEVKKHIKAIHDQKTLDEFMKSIEEYKSYKYSAQPYPCLFCEKAYNRKAHTEVHIERDHADRKEEYAQAKRGAEEADPLQCPLCHKKYAHERRLQSHIEHDHGSNGGKPQSDKTKVVSHAAAINSDDGDDDDNDSDDDDAWRPQRKRNVKQTPVTNPTSAAKSSTSIQKRSSGSRGSRVADVRDSDDDDDDFFVPGRRQTASKPTSKLELATPQPAKSTSTSKSTAKRATKDVDESDQPRGKRGKIPCPVAKEYNCKETFARKDTALRHARRVHTDTPIECPFKAKYSCDKRFASDHDARLHASSDHSAYSEKCPVKGCPYGTDGHRLMRQHLQKSHTKADLEAWERERILSGKGRTIGVEKSVLEERRRYIEEQTSRKDEGGDEMETHHDSEVEESDDPE